MVSLLGVKVHHSISLWKVWAGNEEDWEESYPVTVQLELELPAINCTQTSDPVLFLEWCLFDDQGEQSDHFNPAETSDGGNAEGEYFVALPDDRTEQVHYHVRDEEIKNMVESSNLI